MRKVKPGRVIMKLILESLEKHSPQLTQELAKEVGSDRRVIINYCEWLEQLDKIVIGKTGGGKLIYSKKEK